MVRTNKTFERKIESTCMFLFNSFNICFEDPQHIFCTIINKIIFCSVVVDLLFIVSPIVGVCNCSIFCCTLLYVHSRFAIILVGKRELAGCFA